MADLHIPDESWAAWCQGADVDRDVAIADIRLISAPVVAAELRRIADDLDSRDWTQADSIHAVVSGLRKRADELDPPQSGGAPA